MYFLTMNRFRAAVLRLSAILLLSGCGDSDPEPDIRETLLEVPASVEIPLSGGRVVIPVRSDGAWEVATEASWLTPTPPKGYLDGEVTLAAESSADPWGRTATLRFRTGDAVAETSVVQRADEPVRVDARGHANCYLAAPGFAGRVYAFDAACKGNSDAKSIANVAAARIVWQDRTDLLGAVAYDAATGLIGFTVPGSAAGNAVVAAVDAAGEVLWSWHLWITDYDPEAAPFRSPANENGSEWSFMDRNLGATDARPGSTEALGLLYQWGRKDPFPGAGNLAGDERPVYDGEGELLPTPDAVADGFGTEELSIRNPQVFYKISYKTNDWRTPSDDDLWGGVSRRKTVWDPCPVGWRVPLCDARGASPYGFMTDGTAVWSSALGGYYYGRWWLPCTGTRVYESGALSTDIGGPYGGLWIATAGAANPDAEQFPALYGQYFFVIDGIFFGTNKDSRSQGMAVRCVKE